MARANSSSVSAVRAGGRPPDDAARRTAPGDATTAAPASKASKSLFGVPVPRSTGATTTRALRRKAAMSGTGLTTSTPSRPPAARISSGASAPPRRRRASGAVRFTRGQMSSRSRRAAKRFGRYMRRPVKATTGPRRAGRKQHDSIRDGTSAARKVFGIGRRRREKEGRAQSRPLLGARETRRLEGPVGAPPKRGLVPGGLPRRLRERVHEVHDERGCGQGSRDVREEARQEQSDDEVGAARFFQRRAEVPREESRLERVSGDKRPRHGERNARGGEGHGQDARRERHVRFLPRPGASDDRRLEPRVAQRLEVDLRPEPIAREARARRAGNEQDRLHAGGRARRQREAG